MEIGFDRNEYRELLEALKITYGYDFTDYAESSVKRRISHFMEGRQISSLVRLGKILLEDQTQFEQFVQELSITVTEMFRDPSFYKSVRDKVIKRLATYPIIKIWIAGCATGQEAYSVAILLREEGLLDRSIIYATDINQRSLQSAQEGVYSLDVMKAYTDNYMNAGGKEPFSTYYTAMHNSIVLDRSLKKNIVFSPHNLVSDRSFNEFQFILCRNVLMYFNRPLQENVLNLLHESLCEFGFLGLGDKESLMFSGRKSEFDEVDRKEKIFMKVSNRTHHS